MGKKANKKKISVIIPCYNVEQYLDRCFDSLKKQTIGIENMELIFVNDASSDATLEKLESYEKQFPESIIVINFEENQRQGTARNVALQYATAPYIGYVDSDDWVESTMYEKMVNTIEKYDCDFVECQWDYAKSIDDRNSTKSWGEPGYMNLEDTNVRKEFIRSKIALVTLWDKVFKRDFLVDNDIFCPERILCEDIFFVYLAFVYAKSYYYMDDVLYHYFVNEGGTVRQKKAEYQFDKMTVTFGFLQECIERGLMDGSKYEIEWMFLEKYYVYMLWEIFEQFPERSYDMYIEMKDVITKWVPDYKSNPYRKLEGNEFDNLMLKLLDYDLNKDEFEGLRQHMLETISVSDAQEF
ncbi:MAG: glycosyltransferase family 2 protein [Lachnospiraceae bacterium]|jgi:glycosyltransferase involved in cell wall biosynthesis|nr:glycosyltransferase family 2 protein [Lachnospiraceae bacterium]